MRAAKGGSQGACRPGSLFDIRCWATLDASRQLSSSRSCTRPTQRQADVEDGKRLVIGEQARSSSSREEKMLVLHTAAMSDDGLTNLNWLVQHNPIAPLSPSTPPSSPSPLPYSSNSSSSSVSTTGNSPIGGNRLGIDYSRERVKPPYSYAQLITLAMESHGGGKVLLTDIYSWIRDNFAYFRGNDTSWQNSVRHNLSLNKQFVKVPRDPKDKGKGSYWKLDTNNCNMAKDPYCLRRRNFADSGSSSRRVTRPEVSHPQVNPAIKAFLERVRRVQEARRHPFAGTGETVEDIGAQECVYADTEPLFDDFNRKLFKKDVELYDPKGYTPSICAGDKRKRDAKDGNSINLRPLMDAAGDERNQQAKVRVEYNWEAYEYHPSAMASIQLPLESETVRLDLRIPTPEWWSTSGAATHNLLLSPTNANPMAKVFENLHSGGIISTESSAAPINILSPTQSAGLGDQCSEGVFDYDKEPINTSIDTDLEQSAKIDSSERNGSLSSQSNGRSVTRNGNRTEDLLLDLDCGTGDDQ